MVKSLYNSAYEHDACGVGMIVNIHGNKTHELVDNALTVLENMQHRGAEGSDGKTGDGAGIMVQIPHEFILLQGIPVPEKGTYGTGLVFFPREEEEREAQLAIIAEEADRMGMTLSAVRNVPTTSDCLGETARAVEPAICQVFLTATKGGPIEQIERTLYRIRKRVEHRISHPDFYICSLSSQTIIYKGMLSSAQLRTYFPDLQSPFFTSGLALVHSRFSTNTFPTWSLAQPFRLVAHNGEINTIRGNRGWMAARQSVLTGGALGDTADLRPILQEGMSDSASFDNVFEFLVMSGLSLPHAMAVMVPESFNDKNPISPELKAFYEYHSILMEAWDGPAALLFSDGRYAGGMLDRNGLRPARYTIMKNGTMVVASEVGVVNLDPAEVAEKGRLQPGKILLIDTQEGRIYYDGEIKAQLAAEHPYVEWLRTNRIELETLHSGRKVENSVANLHQLERVFGYTREDIDVTISPMAMKGEEPTAAMGNDTPLAVLSERPQTFFNYFRQQFAQVTNPAIDPIRENLVMSLAEYIGSVGTGILTPDASNCKMVRLPHPILTNRELDLLCNLRYKGFNTIRLHTTFPASEGAKGLEKALEQLCKKAAESVDQGYNYIVLSDRNTDHEQVPIPCLLAVSAVHHSLIQAGKRVQTALIVESGEIREVMHAALVLGYGASALCPYMTFAILDDLVRRGQVPGQYATAETNYIKAIKKGLLKVMAKMGISTIRSYRGAKIFEAVGLSEALLQRYFGTATSTIGGIGLERIAHDAIAQHALAFSESWTAEPVAHVGQFHWRKDGIEHAWTPETIATLQLATRLGSYKKYKEFSALVDNKETPIFLRDFLDYQRSPIPLDEVEPVEAIMRRFVVGAMSFGALSQEAHETIALAMNRIGGRSNTGEGGELSERFSATVDGISLSSKTKQVASGRFGVTTEYLVNAEEIQIKVAQGAKPGEGGQLPGFKVNEVIARTRHSIPGITLISPPPHHDVYSIEDLAQLIFDLKNVNPEAIISVKLVAESGIGTIAAGVAKAKADLIIVSGAEGGTGASPASSMRFAGISPEIGLSETQQTLVRNGLRGQVRLQTDGQLKTGRDIVTMALLGAEEFGFGTGALIVLGCVMMRKCNLNTCPTGVATQDEELRKHFLGKVDHLVNYFTYLAEEVREHLAELGYRSLNDIIGHTELLQRKPIAPDSKAATLDFSRLLAREEGATALRQTATQHHDIANVLDHRLIADALPALEEKQEVRLDYPIKNTDRSTGLMLSGQVAKRYGQVGLPEETIKVTFRGSAGQSFGGFLTRGIFFRLKGEANDYFGKGLSGGRIAIMPPSRSTFVPAENVIAGNTGLYGATSGEIYINGRVGERFGVRNSGATAVIEGAGDHCCEYMTGGRVVVLGATGRNFAAGMSGGIAYVWNPAHDFDYSCNMDMVELNLVEGSAAKELHELVRQHYLYTGSSLARTMLDDWLRYLPDFVQIIPIEYKRVLAEEEMRKLQEKMSQLSVESSY